MMVRNRKSKLMFITISVLIAMFIGVYYSTLAKGAQTVSITYMSEGQSNITTTNTPDADLDSVLLLNFGDGGTSSWTHANISGTYTDANSTTQNASYEAAFAGWKLVSINGSAISKEYIYPDNDFIYFEDEPFASYSTVTSVVFEAVWGKKIYVRDPYNFVNIQDVYGVNDSDGIGNVLTAKFNWDTSTVFSADTNSGASSNAPVSTLRQAYNLLKNSYGGKIQIINHVTLEGPAGQGYNAYDSNFADSKTYTYELGKNLNITGVVTITGKGTGSGKTVENKSADTGSTYANGYLYLKNTNGAGTYSTKSTYAKAPTNTIYFYTDTILEGFNSIAHRENYNINSVRQTGDFYFRGTPDNRFVVENDFYGYKRSTSQAQFGYDTTNWSHSKATGKDKNGTSVTYSALGNGFSGTTHIYGGTNSYGDFTGDGNYYLNVRGGTSWYGMHACGVGTGRTVNNIHVNLENANPGDFTIINSALNCNLVTVRINNSAISTAGTSTGSAINANKIKYVIDGTSNKKITNLYAGSYRTSVSSTLITTKADIDVILRGTAQIGNLYGGGNNISLVNLGTINIDIRNGTVTNIYGGGQGGFVGNASSPATININTTGGTITNIYGAGAGGFVQLSASNSPTNISSYTISEKYAYNTSNKYYLSRNKDKVEYMYDIIPLTLNGATYQTVWRRGVYPEGSNKTNYASYYTSTYQWVVSDALVTADINVNIGGTTKVTGSVYGGGKNGAVTGDINIKISDGATVAKNIYAGGEGLNATIDSTMDYPFKWTGVMADDVLTLDRLEAIANTTGSGFKSAPAAGNYTSPFVLGKELEDSKYMHSDGKIYIYTDAIAMFGAINGNTSVEINNASLANSVVYAGSNGAIAKVIGNATAKVDGSTVKGLYGGGNAGIIDGATTVNVNNSTIKGNVFGAGNVADVTGNVTLTMTGNNTVTGTIYGGSNEGTANGVIANIAGTAVTGNIYAGGNKGNIATSAQLTLKNCSATNIYGGGYSGMVVGNTATSLTGVTATEVFGGGYAGDVRGSTTLTINSGRYTRAFAGCDQAVVKGGTTTVVGDAITNPSIIISDVLYGGGRGVDSNGDGDASDFITVEGDAIVTIAGMNTRIENYGSTKLGSVAGVVDVTFDTYRNDNSTKPYITMNGIDRATNVYLENSYIALENMNADGTKEGIKNIENLHVPSGSGLKVTADSEITGNFSGGGFFYLDSEVTLNVGGNITGTTTLVINPQLVDASESTDVDSSLVIKGGIDNAYLVVKGTSNASNIVCSDARYASRQEYKFTTYDSVTAGFFYIDGDVGIDEQIDSILNSIEGIHYTESSDSWDDSVIIYQDSMFTTNISLSYNFLVGNNDTTSYRNIARSIVLKESDVTGSIKYFPAGTQITMIVTDKDGNYEYYKYSVPSQTSRVYISDFVSMEDDSEYVEITDIVNDDNTSLEGTTASSNIYLREESFRFVVDFTYCETFVPRNTYILYMDIQNDGVSSSALSNNAANIIDIRTARKYEVTISTEGTNYEEQSVIPTDISIKIEASELAGKDRLLGLPLYVLLTVKDPNGNYTNLPNGTVVTVGNQSTALVDGTARFELINAITDNAHNQAVTVNVDMSGCDPYQLVSGKYQFEYSIYAKDAEPEKILTVANYKIMLNRREDNYSVNGIYFKTLSDALTYVETNSMTAATILVELSDDAVTPITIKSGYNITLDLNGKTITGSSNTLFTNNGTFTVNDGIGNGGIVLAGNNTSAYMILNNNMLKITAGKFVSTGGSSAIKGIIGSSAGTVNVQNATITTGDKAIDLNAGTTTLIVENTNVTASSTAINAAGGTTAAISLKGTNNIKSTGNCINLSIPTDINILEGEYVSSGAIALVHSSTGTITLGNDEGNVSATTPILKGKTRGVETNATLNYYDGIVVANNSEPISKEVDDLPEYYKVYYKNSGSTYTAYLENIQNVYWNNEYYETLQNAIDAAKANSVTNPTIQFVKDYTDISSLWTVPTGMTVKVDMNGHTVTKTEGVEVNGVLEIAGNGEIKSNHTYTIKNNGTLTLNDLTISNTSTSTTEKTQAIINETGAVLNVNSGEVYCKASSASTFGASAITDNGGTINVEDGEITLNVSTSQTTDIYDVITLTNGSSTLNLKGGKVSAVNSKQNINGVKILNGAKLYTGTQDGNVSVTNPVIESDGIGVVNTGSTFVIYDGIIKGKTDSHTGDITDWEAGYDILEVTDDSGYQTVFLTDDIQPPTKVVENIDDITEEFVGARVTISDNDRIDEDTLKYLWTTKSSGVTEADLTEGFVNGEIIYAPFGVVGDYYLWVVAKDMTGNTVFGTDGHCFKLENPVLEIGKRENANGKSEIFILGLNTSNKYKNYAPVANNNGTVTSATSKYPTGTAWKLTKTGSAIQRHSLEGAFGNEFSGLRANTYVVVASDYKTSSAAGQTVFESNELHSAAYAKQYSTESMISNLDIVADGAYNHASEVLLLKEDVASTGVIAVSALPNWSSSRNSGTMIIDGIQWFTVPASDISNGVATIKWAYGDKDVSYFKTGGTTIANGSAIPVVKTGVYTVYMKTSEGREVTRKLSVDAIEANKLMATEWNVPANTTIKLPISGTVDAVVDWGDGNVEYISTEYPTHKYASAGTYQVVIGGNVEVWGSEYQSSYTIQTSSNDYTYCSYLTKLKQWGDIGATKYSFAHCTELVSVSRDIPEGTMQGITDMSYMFAGCTSLTEIDFTNWNTSNVTNMSGMFEKCTGLTQLDLVNFDTSNVTSIDAMFKNANKITLLNFGTKFNKLSGNEMFAGASALTTIISIKPISAAADVMSLGTSTGLNTLNNAILYVLNESVCESATNYKNVFGTDRIKPLLEVNGEQLIIIDLGTTYNANTDAGAILAGFDENAAVKYVSLGYSITTEGLPVNTTASGTHTVKYTAKYGTTELMTATRTIKTVDANKLMVREAPAYIDGVEVYYAIGASRANKKTYKADLIKTITITNSKIVPADALDSWDASMYLGDEQIYAWVKKNASDTNMYDLYIGGDNAVIAPTNSSNLFGEYKNCISITGLNILNTAEAENMSKIFYNDINLGTIDNGISAWNTSVVTDMSYAFTNCSNVSSLNLSGWSTSKVTDFKEMFSECSKLVTLNLSGLNTSVALDMSYMFNNCSRLSTLTLPKITAASVTTTESMFYNCSSITDLDLSSFKATSLENANSMFEGMKALKTLTLSGWTPTNLTTAKAMFKDCNVLESVDVKNWSSSKITNTADMFRDCNALTSLDLTAWNTTSITDMSRMFEDCSNLEILLLGKNFGKLDGTSTTGENGLFAGCTNLKTIITEMRATTSVATISLASNIELDTLGEITLYVPDIVSEESYESNEKYVELFTEERIRPILELVGEADIVIRPGESFTDEGVTIFGTPDAEKTTYENFGYTLVKSGGVNNNTSGRYTITYTLNKPANTEVMSVSRKVYVRFIPTAPTITVKQGTKNIENGTWASGDLVVTLSGSTYMGGDMEYIYSLDGENWQVGSSFNFTDETASQMIHAKARGVVEQEDISIESTFEIKLDKTSPVINSHSRVGYDDVFEVIELDVEDGTISSGISGYALSLNSYVSMATWQTDKQLIMPYNGIWYAWVKDEAGNISEAYEFETTEKLTVEAVYNGTTQKFVDIEIAITELETRNVKKATLKLLEPNEVRGLHISENYEFTLDMNGCELRLRDLNLSVAGKLTVENNAGEKAEIRRIDFESSMRIMVTSVIVVEPTGDLTIRGDISISGSDSKFGEASVIENYGALLMNGVVVGAKYEYRALYNLGVATISNTLIDSKADAILNSGTLTITGDTEIYSESTTKPTVSNSGILVLGASDTDVSIEYPCIVGSYQSINNTGTLNFYDGLLLAMDNTTTLNGPVTNVQYGYHLVEETRDTIKGMYLETNDKVIEIWDISETADDDVYATIKICAGDGISDNTKYKLTIGGTGKAKDFTGTYDNVAGWVGNHPWYAKYKDSIIQLELEEGVTKLGNNMFFNLRHVKSIEFPESLTHLGEKACYRMESLTGTVNIPAKVNVIGEINPFANTNIISYTVANGNMAYKVLNDAIVTVDNVILISYPNGATSKEPIVAEGVNVINSLAFTGSRHAETVILPESLKRIESGAFAEMVELKYITIPSGVKNIISYAFSASRNLKYVYLKPKAFNIFEADSTFLNLAQDSIVYTESKEIADLFVPDTTYTSSKTEIYYPFKVLSDIKDQAIARDGTLTIEPEIRTGYIASDVSYQWYKDERAISGATSATYTKTMFTDSDAGVYKLVIKSAKQDNGEYYYTVETNEATVTLGDFEAPESINTSVKYNEDGTATLTITANDKESGVDAIKVNGSAITINKNATTGSATGTFVISQAGAYEISATDYWDNTASISTMAYEIKYIANTTGYTGETVRQIKVHDADINLKDCASKKVGHKFTGWNTKADGTGTIYAANAVYSENSNIELYGTWEILSYLVTFYNDNGIDGNKVVSQARYTYGTTITVPDVQYRTATEVGGSTYRIFYHNNNWTGEKVDVNATETPINITGSNKDSITMIDSDVNYYATYTYIDNDINSKTVRVDGKVTVEGDEYGIYNDEGLVILGEASTSSARPTITGNTSIYNNNGIVLKYNAIFSGPVQGLVVNK